MKTIVHVNQHRIKANRKNGTSDPVLTVKTYRSNRYGHTAEIACPCCQTPAVVRVVYRPDRPLSCGAHVWIETEGVVVVEDLPTPAP